MGCSEVLLSRPSAGPAADLTSRRLDVLLALVVIVLVGPVLGPRDAQAASREAFTAAVVDHHTIKLDGERGLLSVDYAFHDGHYYLDKAPLQPLLAVPFYALYRTVGTPPSPANRESDVALWWLTFWTATVPAAALAVMMSRTAARHFPTVARPAALAVVLGTTMLPFSGMLFGHVLAGAFIYGAWMITTSPELRRWSLPVAGLLAGAAVTTEYPVAVAAGLVTALVLKRDPKRIFRFAVGAAPPAIALLAYQYAAFGSPLRPSYRSSAFVRHQHGLVGINAPSAHVLWKATFGDRGLLLVTPLVLIAALSALVMLRLGRHRGDALVALGLLIVFLLMQAGVDAYGGASPGPRFVVPVLPFLGVPVAAAWRRLPLLCWATTLVGTSIMLLALYTNPYPILRVNGPDVWLSFAEAGVWTHTVFTQGTRTGWPLLAMVAMAAIMTGPLLTSPPRVGADAAIR
ncbi:MAG: hypothetical protein NVS3B21_03380 [Acidimicrobiales bacterium]